MRFRLPDLLPELRGIPLLIFRIIWIPAFFVALFSTYQIIPAQLEERLLSEKVAALGIARDGPNGFEQVRARDPDSGYDIRSGDALIAVDGRPIGSRLETIEAMSGPDGATVELALQGEDDGPLRTIEVTRNSGAIHEFYAGSGLSYHDIRNLELGLGLLQVLAWLAVALLLFLRRSNELVAAMISLAPPLFLANFSGILPDFMPEVSNSVNIAAFGLILAGLLFFPGGTIRPRWTWLGVPLIVLGLAMTIALVALGLPTFPFQPLIMTTCMLFILSAMIVRFRRSNDEVMRQQIKFVLFGMAMGLVLFIISGIWFQLERLDILGSTPWSNVAQDLVLWAARIALPGGILISLLQYRLFDADRVISRSVTYALMTLVIGIAFFAMERVIDFVGNQMIGGGIGAASFGIAAALAAVVLNPLHSWLVRWSEVRFQQKLVGLRDELPETARDMRQISSMDDLLDDFLNRIQPAVHARSAAILSSDKDVLKASGDAMESDVSVWAGKFEPNVGKNGLDLDRTDPMFPLRMELRSSGGASAGWLLLGPRLDDSFYNRDERSTIAILADPMARAIATVGKRERREAKVNREIAELNQRLDELADGIRKLAGEGAHDPDPNAAG